MQKHGNPKEQWANKKQGDLLAKAQQQRGQQERCQEGQLGPNGEEP